MYILNNIKNKKTIHVLKVNVLNEEGKLLQSLIMAALLKKPTYFDTSVFIRTPKVTNNRCVASHVKEQQSVGGNYMTQKMTRQMKQIIEQSDESPQKYSHVHTVTWRKQTNVVLCISSYVLINR